MSLRSRHPMGFLHGHHAEPDPIQVLANTSRLSEPTVPVSLELRTVTDSGGFEDVIPVNREATAALGFPGDLFPTIFADPASVIADDIEAVVAYAHGQPVATAVRRPVGVSRG